MKKPVPENKLREILDASGAVRNRLAADLGVAVKTLYNWEMMKNDIPGYSLYRICERLAVTPGDVYGNGELSEEMERRLELVAIFDGLPPDSQRALLGAARGMEEEFAGELEAAAAEARYQSEVADSWRDE